MATEHTQRQYDSPGQFQTRTQNVDSCDCPIHAGGGHGPFTAPLGLGFADDIGIRPLSKPTAEAIYQSHHSYMDGELHPACLSHHGLTYQGALTGAITYRFPLCSKKRLYLDAHGQPVLDPDCRDPDTIADLPDGVRQRARELAQFRPGNQPVESTVINGGTMVEAHRICLGVRMPNLASCGLAHSQEAFFQSEACPADINYLVTYVRADYPASMIKALRDKGWRYVGWSAPRQAGNRDNKRIRDRYKWVFICPIRALVREKRQTALAEWE